MHWSQSSRSCSTVVRFIQVSNMQTKGRSPSLLLVSVSSGSIRAPNGSIQPLPLPIPRVQDHSSHLEAYEVRLHYAFEWENQVSQELSFWHSESMRQTLSTCWHICPLKLQGHYTRKRIVSLPYSDFFVCPCISVCKQTGENICKLTQGILGRKISRLGSLYITSQYLVHTAQWPLSNMF